MNEMCQEGLNSELLNIVPENPKMRVRKWILNYEVTTRNCVKISSALLITPQFNHLSHSTSQHLCWPPLPEPHVSWLGLTCLFQMPSYASYVFVPDILIFQISTLP